MQQIYGGVDRNDQLRGYYHVRLVLEVLQIKFYFLVPVGSFCDQQLHLISSVRRQSRKMYF